MAPLQCVTLDGSRCFRHIARSVRDIGWRRELPAAAQPQSRRAGPRARSRQRAPPEPIPDQDAANLSTAQRVAPDSTVSGGNILSMLAAMGPFRKRGESILEEHGIRQVDVEKWYPLPAYVDALRTIGQK